LSRTASSTPWMLLTFLLSGHAKCLVRRESQPSSDILTGPLRLTNGRAYSSRRNSRGGRVARPSLPLCLLQPRCPVPSVAASGHRGRCLEPVLPRWAGVEPASGRLFGGADALRAAGGRRGRRPAAVCAA